MASSLSPFVAFIALLLIHGAAAAVPNITEILVRGGQYSTLVRLLGQTQVGQQAQSQLNNSNDGLTIFAPTDNAFNNLKPGALNGLSQQQQDNLLQYHVLPKFYTFSTIQTASNPIRTQANGENGPYELNVTAAASGNQFNLSTGVNTVTVTNALNITSPLAIYTIDSVLLPLELFGNKTKRTPVASSPTSLPGTLAGDKNTSSTTNSTSPGNNNGFRVGRNFGWVGLTVTVGLLSVM